MKVRGTFVDVTPERTAEWERLTSEIALLKSKCMAAGLITTAHAMEAAVKEVGWERARLLAEATR